MKRLCLDTSGYSHFQRGHEPAVAEVSSADWIGISTVAIGELETGFLQSRRKNDNQRTLAELLDEPLVEVLEITVGVARIYSELFVELRKAGTPIPTNDVWIAATALASNARVLTYDSHFYRMKRVESVVLATPG